MEIFVLTIVVLILIVDFLLVLLWLVNFRNVDHGLDELPNVTVLIAARNEEYNLADCLESLMNVDLIYLPPFQKFITRD